MATIRDVYLKAAEEIDFVADRALIARLKKYQQNFINYNEDHINFFGTNLIGVFPMRFRQQDRDEFFLTVTGLDEIDLIDGIKTVDYLKPHWHRPNDPFNLACIWLMYEISRSAVLSIEEKKEGEVLAAQILMYRFMGSLLAHSFPYPADRAAMEATMSKLSRKYAIKTAGTWGKMFTLRAEELIARNSIHYKTFTEFNSDNKITYMVNDIQSRLKGMVKNIWGEFDKVRHSTARFVAEASIRVFDGEEVVREKTRKFNTYVRYMQEILPEKRNFIRDELVSVVTDLVHTVPPRNLYEALEWMSINYRLKGLEYIEQLVENTTLHALALIAAHPESYRNGAAIEPLLIKLRALYTASRMSDHDLLLMRETADQVVKQSVKSKNSAVLASVRTAVQLYIVLRAIAMNHYSSHS